MSFPWSYSVLGLVPGLILTVVIAMIVLYTSLVIWYVFRRRIAWEDNRSYRVGSSVCDTHMSVTCATSAK